MALSGLSSVMSILVCPIDGLPLALNECPGHHLNCAAGHCFDVAKQGYVNLLTVQDKRSKDPGDTKDMITARARVLNSGVYEPLAKLLLEVLQRKICVDKNPDNIVVLDAGCGEGYYLDYCYHALREQGNVTMLGLDISKWAVMAAAKRNANIAWLVATNRHPPVLEQSVDVIVCGFGFPDYSAFKKVLKPGGCVIMLDPGAGHLLELRKIIYPEIKVYKPNDFSLARSLGFNVECQMSCCYQVVMNAGQIRDVLVMSPHLYKASAEGKKQVSSVERLAITVDVTATVVQLSGDSP